MPGLVLVLLRVGVDAGLGAVDWHQGHSADRRSGVVDAVGELPTCARWALGVHMHLARVPGADSNYGHGGGARPHSRHSLSYGRCYGVREACVRLHLDRPAGAFGTRRRHHAVRHEDGRALDRNGCRGRGGHHEGSRRWGVRRYLHLRALLAGDRVEHRRDDSVGSVFCGGLPDSHGRRGTHRVCLLRGAAPQEEPPDAEGSPPGGLQRQLGLGPGNAGRRAGQRQRYHQRRQRWRQRPQQ
mmetsp:Transcript_7809/g.20954  ORF Transcript_7809/g.20954 Transcript_7809/m.20954 type:complete len:241 (-) Transcript_7809:389-1111(-)